MMTLTEFLLARIAEDEAIWGGVPERTPTTDLALAAGNWPDGESAILLTTNRHAAECAAKRRIVEYAIDVADHEGAVISLEFGSADLHAQPIAMAVKETMDDVLELLALPYADYEDYLPEWKP